MSEKIKSSPAPVEGQGTEGNERLMSPDEIQAVRQEIEHDLDSKHQLSAENVAMAREESGMTAGILAKMANSRVGRAIFLGAGALTIMAAKGSFSKVEAAEPTRPTAERSFQDLQGIGKGFQGIAEQAESLLKDAGRIEREMGQIEQEEKAIKDLEDKIRSSAREVMSAIERSIRHGKPVGGTFNGQIADLENGIAVFEKMRDSSIMTKKHGESRTQSISLEKGWLGYAQSVVKFEREHPKEVKEMDALRGVIERLEQRQMTPNFDPYTSGRLLEESRERYSEIQKMYPRPF